MHTNSSLVFIQNVQKLEIYNNHNKKQKNYNSMTIKSSFPKKYHPQISQIII